jgi:hypothetical protein
MKQEAPGKLGTSVLQGREHVSSNQPDPDEIERLLDELAVTVDKLRSWTDEFNLIMLKITTAFFPPPPTRRTRAPHHRGPRPRPPS